MEEIRSLLHGFEVALSLTNIGLMFVGVILGVIIGVLPGLGGANGVAILLPLTFGMAQLPGGTTSAIYVALIGWLGIYAASILFVAFFMRWLSKYDWWKLAAASIGNSVFFFVIFEIWFKIPLPKGPLEALLGLN